MNESKIPLIDQMDGGMDKICTVWLALQATGHLDEEALLSISATLDVAIRELKPVREAINAAHRDGGFQAPDRAV